MIKRLTYLLVLMVLVVLLAANLGATTASGAAYNWLQFNGSPQHSGSNTSETAITPGNVASLKPLFQVLLPDDVDSSPVFLGGVSTATGVRDVLYLAGRAGTILAMDAHSGDVIWSQQNGPGSCKVNNTGAACYTTASPAIDPGLNYIYSYGLDGYVHKYQVGDGVEIKDSHWPELVTLKPYHEKGSSSLSIATAKSGISYLYATIAGYPGDLGDYQGHLVAINLSTGAQKVFNTVCSDQTVHFVVSPGTPDCAQVQGAIWARPGVIYSQDTDKIYMTTGNGDFNPAGHDWGDTVMALNPDGSGANGNPVDAYTPTNYSQLQGSDFDLGSTGPAILPPVTGSNIAHVAVQGGKDAQLRLINLDNLSGQGGPGHTGGEIGSLVPVPQGGEVLTQPAVWQNPANGNVWVFVTNDNGVSGLKVVANGGVPVLSPVWKNNQGGSSPIVANGILFYAGTYSIKALDPTTGNLLWSDGTIGQIHWASPIVANGVVYITSQPQMLAAYTINPGSATNTPPAPTATVANATATPPTGEVVDPANIATLAAGTPVLIDFNNFTNPADGQPIPASYAGCTWNTLVEGSPWAGITTWNFYVANGATQGTITCPRPILPTTLRISSQAANTVTLASAGNPNVSVTTSGGSPKVMTTGWTNPVTTVTVLTTSNDMAVDDLRFTVSGGATNPTPTPTKTAPPVTPTAAPPTATATAAATATATTAATAGTAVDPPNIASLPAGTQVLIDFNNFTNPVDGQPIPANYAGCTWTTLVEGSPWAGIATWNFYVANGASQGTITCPRPIQPVSLLVSSQASNTVTLTSPGNPNVTMTTSGNSPKALTTGWANPVTTITVITTSNDMALDDFRFTTR